MVLFVSKWVDAVFLALGITDPDEPAVDRHITASQVGYPAVVERLYKESDESDRNSFANTEGLTVILFTDWCNAFG